VAGNRATSRLEGGKSARKRLLRVTRDTLKQRRTAYLDMLVLDSDGKKK
jgi:hypothetical protein